MSYIRAGVEGHRWLATAYLLGATCALLGLMVVFDSRGWTDLGGLAFFAAIFHTLPLLIRGWETWLRWRFRRVASRM
jgi:hypothetical protein